MPLRLFWEGMAVVASGWACAWAHGASAPILLAQESAPTTIVGAFIFIAVSMTTLAGFVVKKLLDDAKDDREKFTKTLTDIEASQKLRSAAEDQRITRLIEAQDSRIDRFMELQQVELQRQRDHDAKQMTNLQAVFIEMSKNMRMAVHDVKDSANAAMLKADQVIEESKRKTDLHK